MTTNYHTYSTRHFIPTFKDRESNTLSESDRITLAEDVLDDIGHFVRSVLFHLESNGPVDLIEETFIRLALLVDIFDEQIELIAPFLFKCVTGDDESRCCAAIFTLASVGNKKRVSIYVLKLLEKRAVWDNEQTRPFINALKVAINPKLEDYLRQNTMETNPTLMKSCKEVLDFRKKHDINDKIKTG